MKEGIHPEYIEAVVTCACGNSWTTHSTRAELNVEVCHQCHPFYTGEQMQIVDTEGRVERFLRKYGQHPEQQPEAEASTEAEPAAAE